MCLRQCEGPRPAFYGSVDCLQFPVSDGLQRARPEDRAEKVQDLIQQPGKG